MDDIKKFPLQLPVNGGFLSGEIVLPNDAKALIIFSHGSGSSRFSQRNNFVSQLLNDRGIGTLLFDLLTEEEDKLYSNRFNIDLLSDRLIAVTKYLKGRHPVSDIPFGYFGASTGAASALQAAVALPNLINAVVSRGGRPDLAMEIIPMVTAPTLLIVGEKDADVLQLNRNVFNNLKCVKKLEIVKGATHLFTEKGTLGTAAELSADWFEKYLVRKKSLV